MPSRRLPHFYPEDRWLFLTWHLAGAVSPGHFPPPKNASAGVAFVWLDRQLDTTTKGPMFLRQEAIARLVVQAIHRRAELGHYDLGAFCVMANHVHVLLLPKTSPSLFMKALKGITARVANRLLGRTGQPFWQKESYDHWVRDEREWSKIAAYIEDNPVKAGVVSFPEEYRWSSVDTAGKSACATEQGTNSQAKDG
jgi:REP element-mobilizing transposase RayT